MDRKTPADNWQIIQERWSGARPAPGSDFDKTPTTSILAFEIFVIVGFLLALAVLPRFTKRVPVRFAVMACAVFTFEMFTAPMWRNLNMGSWAYLYQQVSWILTIGWCTLILSILVFVDHVAKERSEAGRFIRYLAILTPIIFVFEIILSAIGLRSYAPEVMESVSGFGVGGIPVEALYYIPVFLTLIISFYKFWMVVIEDLPVPPVRRVPVLRTLGASVVGVVLFELMIEPMVSNRGFPAWSYIYRDVTLLMTGLWVVLLWAAVSIVERLLPHWSIANRFIAYLAFMLLFAIPVEGWLMENGYRSYGPSAMANFSGLTLPWTTVPIEVVFAIPLYFGLVISFVRYAELSRLQLRGGNVR